MKLCVIGDPVTHSLSPAIHTALLSQAGLAGSYTAVRVTADTLPAFLANVKDGAYDGFNVTMPLKRAIVPLLDDLDDDAAAMGAVNTVVVRHGRALGYNTDGQGFLDSVGIPLAGKHVVILGSGGAASAICRAAQKGGAAVTLCCRRPDSAAPLHAFAVPWNDLPVCAAQADVLVNATPLGMTSHPSFADLTFLHSCRALVYDLVYEPRRTALLTAAEAQGLAVRDGLALLYAQAVRAFALFTTI